MPTIRVAFLLVGFLGAVATCENRQVAVITVEGRAPNTTSLGVYYSLDGAELRSAGIRDTLDQFGIEVAPDTSGVLNAQVFLYQNDVPCSLASGSGSVEMPGKYRQNMTVSLSPTTTRCFAATEPADFPTQKMAVWASNANDLWLAGEGGRILHWDGTHYTKMTLPPDLAAAPPDWNAVYGREVNDIWFVGTKNAVAHFTGDALTSVPAATFGGPVLNPLPDWQAIGPGDTTIGDMWLAGTRGSFGYISTSGNSVLEATFLCSGTGGGTITDNLRGVACTAASTIQAPGGYIYRCFFVGDAGRIVAYTDPSKTGGFSCANFQNTSTANLHGVWMGLNLPIARYEVVAVGDGGAVLHGFGTFSTLPAPNGTVIEALFTGQYTNYSGNLPAADRVDLLAITGTGIDNLWIMGKGGVLMSWQDTSQQASMPMPFLDVPSGTTKDLTSGFALKSGIFAGGIGKTLVYSGPLFTPQ